MVRYFVAGNLWLLAAFLVYIGRVDAGTGATRYAFFGFGQLFLPHEYWSIVAMPTAASLLYFVMYAVTSKNNPIQQASDAT